MIAELMMIVAPIGQSIAPAIDLAPERLSVTCGADDPCEPDEQERYRLPLPVERAPNPADRAFDEDGRECGVIGHTVCTGKAHMIVGSGEHADESLTAKLRALDE